MKLVDLKKKIAEYQYFEDTDILDVALASIVATRLKLGDPVWVILIGPSSSGKSQILRPLALTDEKFLHRVDDLTENTFLSGSLSKTGEVSLLKRIGPKGMIVISDLTVIFSKAAEARASILAQLRMVYDGKMSKHVGNKPKPETWEGYLGILAGSTPSIYAHFEEVADMGERFIYYRMKDYDAEKATRTAFDRPVFGRELDEKLAEMYGEYIQEVTLSGVDKKIELSKETENRIIKISMLAEKIRTTSHLDWKNTVIDKIPIAAMPMRVALQLMAIAKGLTIMRGHDSGKFKLTEKDWHIIEWCGYSLANEEKRACLRVLAETPIAYSMSTQTIADNIGLPTSTIGLILQNLASVGVVKRSGTSDGLMWAIKDQESWELLRKIENIVEEKISIEREISREEKKEHDDMLNKALDNFGK